MRIAQKLAALYLTRIESRSHAKHTPFHGTHIGRLTYFDNPSNVSLSRAHTHILFHHFYPPHFILNELIRIQFLVNSLYLIEQLLYKCNQSSKYKSN